MIRKVLIWLGVAFLIFFVASRPHSAANVVKTLIGGVVAIAQGFADFFTNLA